MIRLKLSAKLAYAAPAFALAVVGIPIYVYIPKFYTDVVGVPVRAVGVILLAVRLFDALTDPAIGYLSDRTVTRFGRRRPYIAGASVLVALSVAALFNPPMGSGARVATPWLTLSIFSLFTFWTLVVVPYESLGPELTYDYHERTAVFGFRDGFLIAGTLVAAAAPGMIDWVGGFTGRPEQEAKKFFVMSVLYGPMIVVCCFYCTLRLTERPTGPEKNAWRPRAALRDIRRNRPFVILLTSYVISAFGNQLPATLILFFVQYVLQSSRVDLFLFLYFLTGVAFLPLWIGISRRIGKKAAWLISMGINTGVFAGVLFLGAGDEAAYGVIVVLSGIGFGAGMVLPSSIQADVIDYDELISGSRREGLFIGVWSVAKKITAALGVGAGLYLLGLAGYRPNVDQTPAVVLALKILYGAVPCLCNLLGFGVALRYPLSESKHREIRRMVEKRDGGQAVTDPITNRPLGTPPHDFTGARDGS